MSANQKWLSGRVNGYTPNTLENNWNEERFDIKYLKEHKPLPSQFNHNYTTTYQSQCANLEKLTFPDDNAVRAGKHRVVGYPGHQPELDAPYFKERLETYETDHRVNYLDPRLKLFPFDLRQMLANELQANENKTVINTIVNSNSDNYAKSNVLPAPVVNLERVFSAVETRDKKFKTGEEEQLNQNKTAQIEEIGTFIRNESSVNNNNNNNNKTEEAEQQQQEQQEPKLEREKSNFEKLLIRLKNRETSFTKETSSTQKPVSNVNEVVSSNAISTTNIESNSKVVIEEGEASNTKKLASTNQKSKSVRWQDLDA